MTYYANEWIAKHLINRPDIFKAADWQKMKSAQDIHDHLKAKSRVNDIEIARDIADIMFIEERV